MKCGVENEGKKHVLSEGGSKGGKDNLSRDKENMMKRENRGNEECIGKGGAKTRSEVEEEGVTKQK